MAEELSMDEAFIKKLNDILEINFENERFGVKELAEKAGLSRSQLHRKLQNIKGKSVSRFIRHYRLEKAMVMLQNNVATASEIAYSVGFRSPTYFNTCFHEYFGYPPGEVKIRMEMSQNLEAEPVARAKFYKNKAMYIWLPLTILLVVSWFLYTNNQKSGIAEKETNIPNKKSIAVLPFINWSGDPELEYVSDGMTDAVISRLAKINDIDRLIPFSTIVRYKSTNKTIPEIAKELQVNYILEGNFKLSGDEVQSNLNLIEVASHTTLWSLEYNGKWESDQIFNLQANIAENVAEKMKVDVVNKELNEIQHEPTTSEAAYLSYLKAEYQFSKLSKYGLENAVKLFQEAIKLDSSFVEPYIGLARTYSISGLVWGLLPEQKAWNLAKPVYERARIIDSLKGGDYSFDIQSNYLDGLFYYEYDIQGAGEHMLLELEESHMTIGNFRTDLARKVGKLDVAMKIIDFFIDKYPTEGHGYMQKAIICFMQGDKEKAMKILEETDPLYNESYFYLLETAKWYFYMNEIDKSRHHLELLLENHEDRPPIIYWLIAIHGEVAGNSVKIRSSLDTLQDQYSNEVSGSPAWFIGLYYCHIKDYDQAFLWLQKSYDRKEVEMTWLKEEPLLHEIKDDPRYIELYNKVGFSILDEKSL